MGTWVVECGRKHEERQTDRQTDTQRERGGGVLRRGGRGGRGKEAGGWGGGGGRGETDSASF